MVLSVCKMETNGRLDLCGGWGRRAGLKEGGNSESKMDMELRSVG